MRTFYRFMLAPVLSVYLQGCVNFDPFFVDRDVHQTFPQFLDIKSDTHGSMETSVSGISLSRDSEKPIAVENCSRLASKPSTINIQEAIWFALCNNPKTRESWANIEAAAAQLGSSYAQLVPGVGLTLERDEGHVQEQFPTAPAYNTGSHSISLNGTAYFNWVLYDGGKRFSSIATARQDLIAQRAEYDQALLNVLSNTVQLFFQVTAAEETVSSKKEAEQYAQTSFRVAEGRNKGGIVPLSDVLQAQTALGQASLDRISAEGELEQLRGQFAVGIGLEANHHLSLVPPQDIIPTMKDMGEIDALIAEAENSHPSVLAARAQLMSRESQVDVAAAEGLPTISLTGDLTGARYSGQLSQALPVRQAQTLWGVRVDFPLSDGIDRAYQLKKARAMVDVARGELQNSRLQASLNVWSSYKNLQADLSSLDTARNLFAVAKRSYDLALGRYKNGIGSILDLIDAQSALARAKDQVIQVSSACASDRTNLSTSLGRLSLPNY
jgi:outer membrane protein